MLILLLLLTGKIVLTVPSDADEFTSFALNDEGDQLVTAGRSRQFRCWDLDLQKKSCECTRVYVHVYGFAPHSHSRETLFFA